MGAILAIAMLGAVSSTAGGAFVNQFSVPNTQAQQAIDLLQSRFPQQAGDSSTVVIKAPAGIRAPAIEARVTRLLAELRALPDVEAVVSPLTTPGSISRDGTIAKFSVQYDKQATDLSKASMNALVNLRQSVSDPPAFQVEIGGQVMAQAEGQAGIGSEELYGILAAIVILLLAFGSVVAMGLPIVAALGGLGASTLALTIVARFMSLPSFTSAFAAMIGLGVGIDYSLLVVRRFQFGLARGLTVAEAVVTAMGTAGRTVLFAGTAVVVAMLGLWTVGIPFVSYLGTSAAIVVAFAVLVANSVLPALLTVIGTRINVLRLPGVPLVETDGGIGRRVAKVSRRAPVPVALAAAALMLLIAVPFLSLDLGSSDAGSNPTTSTTRRAYDLLTEGFGPGVNGTIILAVAVDNSSAIAAVKNLPDRLRGVAGVASVAPAYFNRDKTAATIGLIATTSPQADATKALIARLRTVAPQALAGVSAHVYVGGATATFIDLGDKVASRLALFFAVVIGLGFLILMAVFRSIVIPLTAAAMNLLSIGAALGILVAVFQWGWFNGLLGLTRTGPIESFIPMMMFAILFGLSMDYEVFLVSRIHEERHNGSSNADAVEHGVSHTMRLIVAAGAIMASVFLSFAFGDMRVIKEFGIGLSSAIMIDAVVVRLFLVPAVMHVFGDRNWWFPAWLDRIVPQLNIEGTPEIDETPVSGAEEAVA
jgi:RND superfamily putative drug exporter